MTAALEYNRFYKS